MIYYSIRVNANKLIHNNLSQVLGVENTTNSSMWIYEVVPEDGVYFDFVDEFFSLLDGNYASLVQLGVSKEDISFWVLYGYKDQCNLEFTPNQLLRLGQSEIHLCISCFQE